MKINAKYHFPSTLQFWASLSWSTFKHGCNVIMWKQFKVCKHCAKALDSVLHNCYMSEVKACESHWRVEISTIFTVVFKILFTFFCKLLDYILLVHKEHITLLWVNLVIRSSKDNLPTTFHCVQDSHILFYTGLT